MTTPSGQNSVEYKIILQAAKAMQDLQALTATAENFSTKVAMINSQLSSFSKTTGVSMKNAKSMFREIDEIMSKSGEGSVLFGQMQKQGWQQVGDAAEKAGNRMSFAMKAVNIAIGMLIHQGVNLLINTFQNLFNMAIKGLNEMEASMFNIANAEERLSKQGIDIKIEGLEKIIADVQELDPMLSKFQATELVSVLSSKVAPALSLTEGEMSRLANVITVLAVRNQALGKSFEEVQNQVVTGILSGRVTSGINQLGAKITEQAVQEEAVRLGLVRNTEAYKELNSQAKERIDLLSIMSILEANTESELKNLPKFMQSASGLIGTAKAELSDLMTSIGTVMSPIIKSVLKVIIGFLEQMNQWLMKNQTSLMGIAGAIGQLIQSPATIKAIEIAFKALLGAMTAVFYAITKVAEALSWLGDKVPWVKTLMDNLGGQPKFEDTPTGPASGALVPDVSGQAEKEAVDTKKAMEDLQDIMKDNADKLADIARDYQQKIQDIELDGRRKFADIARNRARDLEDAERDYQQSIADINSEATESASEARYEAQQNEQEAEREHQDKLKELKEKYLMDLEEALHERDARQILRLMRQYQIDKNNAIQERERERQDNRAELQQTLQDIEQEKQEKLAKAREELEEKRAEIELNAKRERQDAAIAQGRALQDARIAHNRALAEQREYLQRKLRDLADALQAEYNMTASQADALVQLMSSTYQILSSMSWDNGQQLGTPGSSTGSLFTSSTPVTSSTWAAGGLFGTGGLAEGGSFLATTPTSINVAENRPELITATPLGRPGRDVGKLFANLGSGEGGGGSMEIGLTLSPDLEARIIRKSMDETANVVLRVNRSKVN